MTHRFRAKLKFNSDGITNGIAQWCDDQASQRMDMAFHLNQGQRNEEPSYHNIQNNGEAWECDIFVPDSEKAILEDLFAQIESIWSNIQTPQSEDDVESYMDIHICHNAEGKACETPYMRKEETYTTTESGYPEWQQPEGSHDAYNTGDIVTYEGETYISTIDGNTWSPTEYPQGWDVYEGGS